MTEADSADLYESLHLYTVARITRQRQVSIPVDAYSEVLRGADRAVIFGAPEAGFLLLIPPPPPGRDLLDTIIGLTKKA